MCDSQLEKKLNLVTYPDDILRKQSQEYINIDAEDADLAASMLKLMYQLSGVGLAAPQVGINKRLFVYDVSETRDQPVVVFNPKIITRESLISYEEGCLSFPGFVEKIERSKKIVLEGLDAKGKEIFLEIEDLEAVCAQHELDHLDGVMFFDHLSNFKKKRLISKYTKQQKEN